ncbi:MAG: Rrf2 family transcriptional regulator [Burkholderiales bacterium]|nr:Rrf2 family transcriptional regulator [Burkholderiales bacterium]
MDDEVKAGLGGEIGLAGMPRDSTQSCVLEWLTRRAWRPCPEEQLSQALNLPPVNLRWVMRCLQRRGFVTKVRGANGSAVAWQALRSGQ